MPPPSTFFFFLFRWVCVSEIYIYSTYVVAVGRAILYLQKERIQRAATSE